MNDRPLHSALRELRGHFADPRALVALALVSVILGFAGPFGTYESLPMAGRLAYWAAVAVTTYAVGFFIAVLLSLTLGRRIRSTWLKIVLFSVITGPFVTAVVVLLNLAAFGPARGWTVIDLGTLLFNGTLMALAVNAAALLLPFRTGPGDAPALPLEAMPSRPRIVDRLPLPQRGALLSLSVSDHYVEVTTDRGRGLVLIRLADAIAEAAPVDGLQVHRSHWVALAAVSRAVRGNGRVELELVNGSRVPVSRGFLPNVREAGLA